MDNLYTYYVAPTLDYRAANLWKISKGFIYNDVESSMQTLQAYLESIPYQDSRFDENHYTQMLYVVFSLLGLHVDSQVRTAKGRLDIVIKTDDHVYVMEVKLDLSLDYDYVRRQISDNHYKHMSLFNASAQYKLKQCVLRLELTNLFNQRHYAYTLFDGINTYSYDYGLCGRTLMMKATFKL